jgi:hypothetical protein
MERIKTLGSNKRSGSYLSFVIASIQNGQQRALCSRRPRLHWGQTPPALWILSIMMCILYGGVVPTRAQESSNLTDTVQQSTTAAKPAQESSDIAKAAQNPIAHMISVPLENDFYPQTGINKENEYVL